MGGSAGQKLTSGGVAATPLQQALGQYTTGEGLVQTGFNFAPGPALSTNATQSDVGNMFAGAKQTAESSLANTAAQQAQINNAVGGLGSGLGGLLGGLGRLL